MLERLAAAQPDQFVVDSFVVFTVAAWTEDSDAVVRRVKVAPLSPTVIVRSSAVTEDADATIAPGMFHSALHVPRDDAERLSRAIDKVIASYGRHAASRAALLENEIIVQSQLLHPLLSGIARLRSGESYVHVDYDTSLSTNAVTSGQACTSADFLLANSVSLPKVWAAVRQAIVSVQSLTAITDLLVEFAVSQDNRVHVFQARALDVKAALRPPVSTGVVAIIEEAATSIDRAGSIWSDMADWNPAELLGDRPQPLARSLFEFLISDGAWLLGRSSLGYRSVWPTRLVLSIAGKPYVDVRRSFLSLTPQHLRDDLAARLVEDRVTCLRSEPWLHDKVETVLLFTAADVARPPRTQGLLQRGMSARDVGEIERQLVELTNSLIEGQPAWATRDAGARSRLALRGSEGDVEGKADLPQLAKTIGQALARCRDDGVIPFARHARLAFVARDLVSRLRDVEALPPEWEAGWWAGVHTVVQDVALAVRGLAAGTIDRRDFNGRVGHLRARTFDICSPRYDAIEEVPILSDAASMSITGVDVADMTEPIGAALAAAGLRIPAAQFLAFAKQSIQLRETLKFEFSRVLSNALERIAVLGERLGIGRQDIAYVALPDLEHVASGLVSQQDARAYLLDVIAHRREEWQASRSAVLPDLIFEGMDLRFVPQREGRPNFITDQTVDGEIKVIEGGWNTVSESLDSKVVAIESADPGFDWIFAFQLAGLVTKYGGATSHMAVRCEQLRIPAAIGCGEVLYREAIGSTRVRLDCAARRVTSLAATATTVPLSSARV